MTSVFPYFSFHFPPLFYCFLCPLFFFYVYCRIFFTFFSITFLFASEVSVLPDEMQKREKEKGSSSLKEGPKVLVVGKAKEEYEGG